MKQLNSALLMYGQQNVTKEQPQYFKLFLDSILDNVRMVLC